MARRVWRDLGAAERALARAEERTKTALEAKRRVAEEIERLTRETEARTEGFAARRAEVLALRARRPSPVGVPPADCHMWTSEFCPRPVLDTRNNVGAGRCSTWGRRPQTDYGAVIADWMRTGDTYTDVGKRFGITRERVRQIVKGCAFDWEKQLVAARAAARKRLRALGSDGHVCRFCNVWFVSAGAHRINYCREEHREMRTSLRFVLDAEARRHQNIVVARRRWEVTPTETRRATYERVLAGTQRPWGGWFQKDSAPFHAAMTAYRNGWPIFEELPESFRAQIVEASQETVAA